MISWSRETYIRAYRFAAEAHQGQKIPGTDRPYIAHSAMVAMEIITVLSNEPGWNGNLAIQCALLHDVLEDTDISYEQIDAHFGRDVADGVQALSHNHDIQDRNERVIDTVRRIRTQPWEVWMVKLADRIVTLLPPRLTGPRRESPRTGRKLNLSCAILEKPIRFYPVDCPVESPTILQNLV